MALACADGASEQIIEVIAPASIAEAIDGMLQSSCCAPYKFVVTPWSDAQSRRDSRDIGLACPHAALHVALCDTPPWLLPAIVETIVGDASANERSPLSQIALVSFSDGSWRNRSNATLPRSELVLFDQVFGPHHIRLPISAEALAVRLAGILIEAASHTECASLQADIRRARVALDSLRTNPHIAASFGDDVTRMDAWQMLAPLSVSDDRRLREEHDASDIHQLLRYQCIIDHYYLITGRPPGPERRQYLFIEDNPEPVRRQLETIAQATGASFWVTENGAACGALHDALTNRREVDLGNSLIRIPETAPGEPRPSGMTDFDAALVDLLIQTQDGNTISGEEIIELLHDTHPELPVHVVSRSEEPDVLARCVSFRGADRVIPKRRILRLPHTHENYLYESVSPLLPVLAQANSTRGKLDRELLRLYRLWNHEPDILWLGEKTFQGPEHSIEHHRGLWQLVADVLTQSVWDTVRDRWMTAYPNTDFSPEEVLFCFLLSVWLHDIGCRGNGTYQTGPEVRPVHAFISGQLIDCPLDARALGLWQLNSDLRSVVADICRYHQSSCPVRRKDLERCDRSLFPEALEDKRPFLLPWISLLRFLDAVEHGWKRTGGRFLYRTRRRAVHHELEYYSRQADEAEGKRREKDIEYVRWLRPQTRLLSKHNQVLEARILVEPIAEGWAIFPGFRYAPHVTHGLPGELAAYVSKEWNATGDWLELVGITWPKCRPMSGQAEYDTISYVPDTEGIPPR